MNVNKNNIIGILLFVIAVLIASCVDGENNENKAWNLKYRDGLLYKDSLTTEPFTGHYKGKIMGKDIEYDVVDGKKHGTFVLYHGNGNIETFGNISENKNHGEWRYYHPNGVLESVGMFKDDKPDSIWNWYYITGSLMQEGNFNEGKKDGEWKIYDDLGNLRLMMKYNNDELKDSVAYELPEISDTLVFHKDSIDAQ